MITIVIKRNDKHRVASHFSLLQKAILDLEKSKGNWDLRINMAEEEDTELNSPNELIKLHLHID